VLAFSVLTACGGQTKDEPAQPSDGPLECPQGIGIDQNFGNGPLDGLVGAVRAIRDIDATTRAALYDEVGALSVVYDVHGRGERTSMSELVPAIADDIAKNTASGITAKLGPISCVENIEATSASEAECLKEGCDRCDAATLCAGIGRLNGLASATCDGPTFDIASAVAAPGLPADQLVALQNRVEQLKAHAPKILALYARLSAIVTGSAFGTVIFDPSPAVEIKNEFETLASADRISGFGIEPCITYAVPYLTAALAALGDETTAAPPLLDEGDQFLGIFQR
jgi:hypothetical protein